MPPSFTDKSQAHEQREDHETYVKVNGMTGSIPANSQQEMDSIHSSHFTPDVYAGSAKLTSPERIIALHRELRQNHCKNCQVSRNWFWFSEIFILGSHFIDHVYISVIVSRDAQLIVSLNELMVVKASCF